MEPISWFEIVIAAVASSVVGGVIGGLVAWGGIRIRLDHLEKKMSCLSRSVIYKDVFQQHEAVATEREKRIEDDIKDIKKDLKIILSRSFKTRKSDENE